MSDMINEAEKNLNWIQKSIQAMKDLIRKMFIGLKFLFGKLWNHGYLEVGQRKGDAAQVVELSFKETIQLDRDLNEQNLEHAFNFVDKDGKQIDPKHKHFRKINHDFKVARSSKTHIEIEKTRAKELTAKNHKLKIAFVKKHQQIKGENNPLKLSNEDLNKIFALSKYDFEKLVEGNKKYTVSGAVMERKLTLPEAGIDERLTNFILQESETLRNYYENKELVINLNSDISRSEDMEDLRNLIQFKNNSQIENFEKRKEYILKEYQEMQLELSEKKNSLERIGTTDLELREVVNQRIKDIEKSPIFSLCNDKTLGFYEQLIEADGFSTQEHTQLHEENIQKLLINQYRHRTSNEYKTEDFAKNEKTRTVEHNKAWTKFCEKWSYLPFNRKAKDATLVESYKKTTYDLDGNEVEGVNGTIHDVYSEERTSCEAVNYNSKQRTKFAAVMEKFNKAIAQSRQKKEAQKQAEKEAKDREAEKEPEIDIVEQTLNENKALYEQRIQGLPTFDITAEHETRMNSILPTHDNYPVEMAVIDDSKYNFSPNMTVEQNEKILEFNKVESELANGYGTAMCYEEFSSSELFRDYTPNEDLLIQMELTPEDTRRVYVASQIMTKGKTGNDTPFFIHNDNSFNYNDKDGEPIDFVRGAIQDNNKNLIVTMTFKDFKRATEYMKTTNNRNEKFYDINPEKARLFKDVKNIDEVDFLTRQDSADPKDISNVNTEARDIMPIILGQGTTLQEMGKEDTYANISKNEGLIDLKVYANEKMLKNPDFTKSYMDNVSKQREKVNTKDLNFRMNLARSKEFGKNIKNKEDLGITFDTKTNKVQIRDKHKSFNCFLYDKEARALIYRSGSPITFHFEDQSEIHIAKPENYKFVVYEEIDTKTGRIRGVETLNPSIGLLNDDKVFNKEDCVFQSFDIAEPEQETPNEEETQEKEKTQKTEKSRDTSGERER